MVDNAAEEDNVGKVADDMGQAVAALRKLSSQESTHDQSPSYQQEGN